MDFSFPKKIVIWIVATLIFTGSLVGIFDKELGIKIMQYGIQVSLEYGKRASENLLNRLPMFKVASTTQP